MAQTKNQKAIKELRFMIRLDQDLTLDIANNMKEHGGSFVQSLGECLIRADGENRMKLFEAFTNYFLEYHPKEWKPTKNENYTPHQ